MQLFYLNVHVCCCVFLLHCGVFNNAGFYSGPVAEAIVAALQERGGVMTAQDLANHKTLALEPISTTYK